VAASGLGPFLPLNHGDTHTIPYYADFVVRHMKQGGGAGRQWKEVEDETKTPSPHAIIVEDRHIYRVGGNARMSNLIM